MTVLRCACGAVAEYAGDGADDEAFCATCMARFVSEALASPEYPPILTMDELLRRLRADR